MPYNRMIDRTGAAGLIPVETGDEIITNIARSNPILALARRAPNMAANQTRVPVASALATAYFVQGDTGLKRTTDMSWSNRFLVAEDLACIVPIAQNVLEDSAYDIWGELRPEIERSMISVMANAVLNGVNIPASWTTNLGAAGIVAGATAAGQTRSAAAYPSLYQAILGETAAGVPGVFGSVEVDGFRVTGNIANTGFIGKLRGMTDTTGQPIFKPSVQAPGAYELDGTPVYFPNDASMPATAWLISGQWDQLVYAFRREITYNVFTEGVVQDASGTIVFNLMQQDMVALRAVMRVAFALPNPVTRSNTDPATRYPFAVLTA